MDGMNVATKIELPIKVLLGENREEIIGQFYASVGRNLGDINIQMYISNKELAQEHMETIKQYYLEFIQGVYSEAMTFGYDFMRIDTNMLRISDEDK